MKSDDSLHDYLAGPVTKWAAVEFHSPLTSRLCQDALGAAGQGWFSHAGLLQLLLWAGRADLAADLAELTIAAFGAALGSRPSLADEEYPFNDALLAERRYDVAGNDARLQRLVGILDPGSSLGRRIAWLQANLNVQPLDRVLSGYNGWQEPITPLGPAYAKLVAKFDKLSDAEARRLWTGAYNAHDAALADQLAARYGTDILSWYVAAWYAGIQVERGAVGDAQQILLSARDRFSPFAEWDLLPLDPVLQTVFEPTATPEFRRRFIADLSPTRPWETR